MLTFKELTIDDKEWMQSLLDHSSYRCEEYSFTFTYLWRNVFAYRVARMNDYVLIKSVRENHPTSYLFPAGKGELKPVIDALFDDAKAHGEQLVFHTVPTKGKALLDEFYPDTFQFLELTDYWDYIYDSQRMISLSGKKLSGKRNHINRFIEHYPDWSYEEITADNMPDVIDMSSRWIEIESKEDTSTSFEQEANSVDQAMHDFFKLGLTGGLLRADGEVVAFTMGDRLTDDTFLVHIEKAFKDIQGAYPMINQQFAIHVGKNYTYINREDDSGNEGLRKAKRSYQPVMMGEKHAAKAAIQ